MAALKSLHPMQANGGLESLMRNPAVANMASTIILTNLHPRSHFLTDELNAKWRRHAINV